MERNKLLEDIAGAANAAIKIRNLRNSMIQQRSETLIQPDKIIILSEILKTLAEYSPEHHKHSIGKAVDMSNLYSNTYKSLRHHIRSTRDRRAGTTEIMKTLDIVKPILPNHHKTVIEKMRKIFDIINS